MRHGHSLSELRGRAAGATSRAKAAPRGAEIGLLGKLKGSLPNIGIKRLQALTF